MGMPITVEIVDPHVTEADIANVFAYFHAVDATFSTYKEHSEMSKPSLVPMCTKLIGLQRLPLPWAKGESLSSNSYQGLKAI